MDPRIRIHTKMSWIRNTALMVVKITEAALVLKNHTQTACIYKTAADFKIFSVNLLIQRDFYTSTEIYV